MRAWPWRTLWLLTQKALVVALVMASAVGTARITWFWLQPAPSVDVPTIQPVDRDDSGGDDPEQLGRQLAQRALFGEVVAEPAEEEDAPVEAPETRLNLVLQAVAAMSGEGRGFAIIAQRSGQSRAFSVGEEVFGQAELAAVYGDRVILDRDGQMETLRYERDDSSASLQPTEDADSDANLGEAVEQAQNQASQGGDVRAQVEQMVSYVRERAASDPRGLLDEVGLEPTSNGYQVTRRARQLQMAGLRPGDVVTAVNDNPVGNLSQDQALLNQILQTGGELKIQIQRGSRTFTIYQSIPNF